MGYNLHSCCHVCKVQIMHFRKEEDKTILPFYVTHKYCSESFYRAVETFMDNNGDEPQWLNEYQIKKNG